MTSMRPRPRSPYAVAKLAAETLGQAFTESYGLEVVALRYFNVFGPRQDPHSAYSAVIPRFIDAVLDARPVTIFGDGNQSRDFTFIDNVVHANLLAAQAEGVAGEVFNIATGRAVSVLGMLEAVCAGLQRTAVIEFQPERVGDVRDSLADIQPAADLLAYRPQTGFEDGIARTIASFAPSAPSEVPALHGPA
jgi:UDP-glucose 4-epimerase